MQMQRIAVSSEGPLLDDMVDPRFGRAAGFVLVDQAGEPSGYIDNGASQVMAQGAGIQAAQNLAGAGVELVISGFVGPKAFQALSAAGIQIIQNVEDVTVGQAVERFKRGELTVADAPNSEAHGGSDRGSGRGSGQRTGQGSGQGSGQGRGLGSGQGTGQGRDQGCGQGRGLGSGQGTDQGRGQGCGQGSGQGRGQGARR